MLFILAYLYIATPNQIQKSRAFQFKVIVQVFENFIGAMITVENARPGSG